MDRILTVIFLSFLLFLIGIFYYDFSKNVKRFEEEAVAIDQICKEKTDNIYLLIYKETKDEKISKEISTKYYKECIKKMLSQ